MSGSQCLDPTHSGTVFLWDQLGVQLWFLRSTIPALRPTVGIEATSLLRPSPGSVYKGDQVQGEITQPTFTAFQPAHSCSASNLFIYIAHGLLVLSCLGPACFIRALFFGSSHLLRILVQSASGKPPDKLTLLHSVCLGPVAVVLIQCYCLPSSCDRLCWALG